MKKIVIGTLAAAIVLGGSLGMNQVFADDDDKKTTVVKKKTIGTKKAKAVALKKVKGGKVDDIDLDKDGKKVYYEVEIERKNKEYEVYVDAYTAKVLKVETGDDIDEDDDDDQK